MKKTNAKGSRRAKEKKKSSTKKKNRYVCIILKIWTIRRVGSIDYFLWSSVRFTVRTYTFNALELLMLFSLLLMPLLVWLLQSQHSLWPSSSVITLSYLDARVTRAVRTNYGLTKLNALK